MNDHISPDSGAAPAPPVTPERTHRLRWHEVITVAVIVAGVVINARIMLATADDPSMPVAESVTSSTVPVTVAGESEERPQWAKELSDQLAALSAELDRRDASTTVAPTTTAAPGPRATARPTSGRPSNDAPARPAPPVVLIPPQVQERTTTTTTEPTTTTAAPTTTTPAPTTTAPTTTVAAP